MATLAEQVPESGTAAGARTEAAATDPFRLPPLPWEDVYLHVKRIDNSRLERASDPAARRSCWRAIRAAGMAVGLLVLILLPDVLDRGAGRQLAVLEKQRQALAEQKAELELAEAALLSPARMEEWARSLELADPAPGQVLSLNPRPDRSLPVHAHLR